MPIGGGGRTPDQFPGDRVEDAILIVSGTQYPVDIGEVSYVSGTGFAFKQDDGIALIRSGNINASDHEKLLQAVHLTDDNGPRGGLWSTGYVCDTGPWPFPTASVWWTDSTRTKRFMDQSVIRNVNRLIVSSSWRIFQSDGVTIADSYTDVITYNGVFETSRTRKQP